MNTAPSALVWCGIGLCPSGWDGITRASGS